MRSLISKSIALARHKSFDEHPHYKSKLYLQSVELPGQNDTESWIGGNPRLPEPFIWPSYNGTPYQFICQINCAQVPKHTWGGSGPREGWFAIFFGIVDSKIGIKIIYAKSLGPERRAPNSQNKHIAWHNVQENMLQYLRPAVAWSLKVSANRDADVENVAQRPFEQTPMSILSPEHQPASWSELSLLLDCVKQFIDKKFTKLNATANELEKRKQYKNPILDQIIDRRINCLGQLEANFLGDSKRLPYGFELWKVRSPEILDIQTLSDEYKIENGYPLTQIVKYRDIENLWYTLSHFIPAQSKTFDEIKQLSQEAITLNKELSSFEGFPVPTLEDGSVNLSQWREFKQTNPQEWSNFSDRIRSLNKRFYAITLRHISEIGDKISMAENIRPEMYVYNMFFGKVPQSWDETLTAIRKRKNEVISLKTANGQLTDYEVNQLAQSQSLLPNLAQLKKYIENCQHYVEQNKSVSIFNIKEWGQLFQTLEDNQNNHFLGKHWSGDYSEIRLNMAKQNYSNNNIKIYNSHARRYFETLWNYDAKDCIIQLGGMPRKMCNEFSDQVPKVIMLMQIPTNRLTDTIFGDVSDLVISIPAKNLKRGSFTGAFADIPN